MGVPVLTKDDVEKILSGCKVLSGPYKGGQKIVFLCETTSGKFALKFIEITVDDDETKDAFSEIVERAKREVRIMGKCESPFIVKLGPILIESVSYKDKQLLYFSEEWINGKNLKEILKEKKRLSDKETIKLAMNITSAISTLWDNDQVHRDIKPENIMYDEKGDRYVMLDLGLALDLEDKSLTRFGMIPCTKIYVSPDQLSLSQKRQLDFRADLFCLGIVLYEAYLGEHPFFRYGMRDDELFRSIIHKEVQLPTDISFKVNEAIYGVIKRMLNKRAHKRYRSCQMLMDELEKINEVLEEY